MTKIEMLDTLLSQNKQVLKVSDVMAAGISKTYFHQYVKAKDLQKFEHGASHKILCKRKIPTDENQTKPVASPVKQNGHCPCLPFSLCGEVVCSPAGVNAAPPRREF